MSMRKFQAITIAAAAAAVLFMADSALRAQRADHWVGTWATAVVVRPQGPPAAPAAAAPDGSACAPAAFGPPPGRGGPAGGGRAGFTPPAPLNFKNQTLRQIVHVSLGGDRLRVVLSNAFGTIPLEVGAAHVALREKDAAIQTKSDRPLCFTLRSLVWRLHRMKWTPTTRSTAQVTACDRGSAIS